MENGSAFLLGKSTSRKPLWKNITGYPSGQYDSGDPGEYRLHETPNFTNPARVSFGPYLWINGVTSYGGNSGGPIWGWTNNRWAHFGVVVSNELISTIIKLKPSSAKGAYVKSIYMSSTMSPSVQVDPKSVGA